MDTLLEDVEIPEGRFYTGEEIRALAEGTTVRTTTLKLDPGDSAHDFNSTKGKRVWGPTALVTQFFPDGGIDQHAMPVTELPRKLQASYVEAATVEDRLAVAARKNPPKRKPPGRKPEPRYTSPEGETKTMRAWLSDPRRNKTLPDDVILRRVTGLGWNVLDAIRTPLGNRKAAPIADKTVKPEGTGKRGQGPKPKTYQAFGLEFDRNTWCKIIGIGKYWFSTMNQKHGLEEYLRRRGWTRETVKAARKMLPELGED